MTIELFVVFSSIAIVLFALFYIFVNNNINIIILGIYVIYASIIVRLLIALINPIWVRIKEISVRFSLDCVPIQQMGIEIELSVGNITKKEADIKIYRLQKKINYFSSIDNHSEIFLKTCKIITTVLICILFIFLIINVFKILAVYNKYIMGIIIIGIISLLILFFKTLYIDIIVQKKVTEYF
jgi:flagellar biosynthesis protein FlhA